MPQADFSGLSDERRAELWAVLALYELKRLGVASRTRLVEHFGSAHAAVRNVASWAGMGVKPEAAEAYTKGLWREPARKKWDLIRASGENLLLYLDDDYPNLLREIPDPPLLIFYRGDVSLLQNASVGVVGARKCTREGMSVAVDIVRGLSRAGVTTISGLARGIDRVVHLAGLEGAGGSIAVLGCGIDVVYPRSNLDLYDLMRERGLIITEFFPGTAPKQYNFPVRNRIISGLSRGILVVEAAMRSGTLITARHAAEQGRDVFAVPGSTVSDISEGCRDLIRRGARPVFSAEDILLDLAPVLKGVLEEKLFARKRVKAVKAAKSLDECGILPWDEAPLSEAAHPADTAPPGLDEKALAELCAVTGATESKILNFLNARPNCHIDIICNELELDAPQVSRILIFLEVQGLISRLPGMYYNIRP